jgi:hypothetical protein
MVQWCSVDALLRVFVLGFWRGQNTYLRSSGWNRADFLIIVVSW